MTDWKTVHDSRPDKPSELDTTSSQYTVYVRRNIHRTIPDPENNIPELWEYDQMTYTKEEYALLTGPQTQSIMQAVNEQSATTIMAMLSDTTALDALMQAINQQTADIAAMTMGG